MVLFVYFSRVPSHAYGGLNKRSGFLVLGTFPKREPCREQNESKINVNCNMCHITFGFFLSYLSLIEFWGWETFFGSGVLKVPLNRWGGGCPYLIFVTDTTDSVCAENWSCGEILPMTCCQVENFSTWQRWRNSVTWRNFSTWERWRKSVMWRNFSTWEMWRKYVLR